LAGCTKGSSGAVQPRARAHRISFEDRSGRLVMTMRMIGRWVRIGCECDVMHTHQLDHIPLYSIQSTKGHKRIPGSLILSFCSFLQFSFSFLRPGVGFANIYILPLKYQLETNHPLPTSIPCPVRTTFLHNDILFPHLHITSALGAVGQLLRSVPSIAFCKGPGSTWFLTYLIVAFHSTIQNFPSHCGDYSPRTHTLKVQT